MSAPNFPSPERQRELADVADRRRREVQRALAARTQRGPDPAEERLRRTVRDAFALKAQLAEEAKTQGCLDLNAILRSPVQRAALAMLEADAEIVLGAHRLDGKVAAEWIAPERRRGLIRKRRAREQAVLLKDSLRHVEEIQDSS